MLSLRHSAIPLDNVLGPWLLGVVVSSIVFGITSLQIYAYYTRFSSRDPLFLKTFELTRTNESSALCRSPTQRLQLFLRLWFKRLFLRLFERLQPLTQSRFYAYRIWILSGKLQHRYKASCLPAFILTLPTCKFDPLPVFYASLIEQVDRRTSLEIHRTSPTILTSLQRFIIIGLSLEIICDLLITGGIVTNLRKSRSKFERLFAVCTIAVVSYMSRQTIPLLMTPHFFFVLIHHSLILRRITVYACSFMSMWVPSSYSSFKLLKIVGHMFQTQFSSIPSNSTAKCGNGFDCDGPVGEEYEAQKIPVQ
ncbi:hypothetical protein R3P38DRAFT_2800663 [Favolaschia claudopus]|uniref:Uncharacterized protein n=1 Tax=Favolaschia claudopus TaxID=2862362 RepID=A0AAV9ZXC6_9AGAR